MNRINDRNSLSYKPQSPHLLQHIFPDATGSETLQQNVQLENKDSFWILPQSVNQDQAFCLKMVKCSCHFATVVLSYDKYIT